MRWTVSPARWHHRGVGVGGNDLDDLLRDLPLVLNDVTFAYPLVEKVLQQLGRDFLSRGREQAMHIPSLPPATTS